MIHLIPLALLVVVIGSRLILDRPIPASIGFYTGFAAYFVLWGLFCWSEWRSSYGVGALAGSMIASAMAGTIFGTLYALGVATVGRLLPHHEPAAGA